MTKYIRSLNKLVALIKDIFGDYDISIDTRAIALFLAGIMPNLKFNDWIDSIGQLDDLNYKYKEINMLKNELGVLAYEYIVISIIKILDRDICSDELQQFIQCSSNSNSYNDIEPALTVNSLQSKLSDLNEFKAIVTNEINKKLSDDYPTNVTALIDIYSVCRKSLDPNMAYHAIEAGIIDILVSNGIPETDAKEYSDKLVTYSFKDLIHDEYHDKSILHCYRQSAALR